MLALGLAAAFGVALLMTGLSVLSGSAKTNEGVEPATRTITVALDGEPPNLDSSLTADAISGFVLGHVMEGLLRLDEKNQLAPGVAERWEISSDGATFWLREDARWSDGKPVTAHDFVYAWRKTVDPASASEYANIMNSIRNADEISAGKLPPETLGVQAVGDRILKVQFAKPVPYFDRLVTFTVFFPIREDFAEKVGGRYAADADTLLYNGPFEMVKWVHGAHIRFQKNPDYWDKGRIAIDVIDIPYFTTDPSARVNLFRDKRIAQTELSQQNLEEAQLLGWDIKSHQDGSVFYVEFNHRQDRLSRNRNFRKAIQYATDSSIEVNKVIKVPGYLPGKSVFPVWLDGVNDKFRREYPVSEYTPDTARAREHLARAKQELGLKEFPPIMLLTGDTPLSARVAEYYQDRLKRELGLDVRIDSQTFKQRLAKMLAGEFDLVMAGWGPDYSDPLTFGDLFMTGNANNRGQYSNPAYDEQVRIAQNSNDRKTRMDAFGRIQQIIFDDAVILPEYERTRLFAADPRVKGIVRRVFGADVDYTYASIEKE